MCFLSSAVEQALEVSALCHEVLISALLIHTIFQATYCLFQLVGDHLCFSRLLESSALEFAFPNSRNSICFDL